MENILPAAPLEEITLQVQYTEAFAVFCRRNHIPFEIDGCTYRIRAGIDHTDALIMACSQGWLGEVDPNEVNLLVMEHEFRSPLYDYELFPCPRDEADEMILSAYR